jgi:hypothetical protein
MSKITDKDYLNRLKEQRDFLRSDLEQYEKGQAHFAYRMASTLRTIFHDTSKSTAILPALAQRHGASLSFKGHRDRDLSNTPLYLGFMTGNLRPPFDAPSRVDKNFDDYWNETIYVEGNFRYTRKQLVLFAANKLGGAHVAPEIPENMLVLVQGNVRLGSKAHPEEFILTRAVYETGWQVLQKLDTLIPELEKQIKPSGS